MLHGGRLSIPMPVLSVGIGLETIASHVEPHRRIECCSLVEQYVHQLVMKRVSIGSASEIPAPEAPIANGLSDAAYQSTHAAFTVAGAQSSVQILAGNDVRRRHRPVFRDFDVLLLEDGLAL